MTSRPIRCNDSPGKTRADRYQITAPTWRDIGGQLGLSDFGPHTQDLIAVGLLQRSKALEGLQAGDLNAAMDQAHKVWDAVPGRGEQYGVMSPDEFKRRYQSALQAYQKAK